MKDILVDNTVAKNFCNPLDPHYKTFIQWIFEDGVLVVTQSLLSEYASTSAASPSDTNIAVLVNRLTQDGRLKHFTKEELTAFRFSSRISKKLRSNRRDHDNIKAVMLSARKYTVSHDKNFRQDVNSYPGYSARAEKRPQDIPYR